jgi:hypothetical protein
MRTLKAIKKKEQKMVEVTQDELRELVDLNPWISLGKYDLTYHVKKDGVIGYIAGDIGKLQMHKEDMQMANHPFDCWFINKEFFDENYIEVEETK